MCWNLFYFMMDHRTQIIVEIQGLFTQGRRTQHINLTLRTALYAKLYQLTYLCSGNLSIYLTSFLLELTSRCSWVWLIRSSWPFLSRSKITVSAPEIVIKENISIWSQTTCVSNENLHIKIIIKSHSILLIEINEFTLPYFRF